MIVTPTEQQRRAIEADLGPVLVIAGPGAGKTFCLIGRIHHLTSTIGVSPQRICAVTFTNKAAEEIASRLATMAPRTRFDITGGTLHALCVQMLRTHGTRVDLPPGFGIADEDYQAQVLRRIGVPRRHVHAVLGLIRRHKLDAVELNTGDRRLHDEYQAMLQKNGVVDFDDIILLTDELLAGHPDIAVAVAQQWDHLLVDEFQDISLAQFNILKRIAPHQSIFAVGDDEQSIFSWAGADPDVLPRFARDYGIEHPVVLEENRRCSRQIFETARTLLAINPSQFKKQLRAAREGDHEVTAHAFLDEDDECMWLLADIRADRKRSNRPWGDYAILYRQHQVGTLLEKQFVTSGIPCRLARGRSLLDDRAIAYTIDSLRIMLAPDDPIPVHTFAERVLPRDLLEQVRSRTTVTGDLLGGLRAFARARGRGDPESRIAWRFVFHVENLHALWAGHTTLAGLFDEVLSHRVGRYTNPLRERADELTDPADHADAAVLAATIQQARADGGVVWIEPAGGLEFAHRAMCEAAGLELVDYRTPDAPVRPTDAVIDAEAQSTPEASVRLFKALQLVQGAGFTHAFRDFVTFDLETTDRDTESCEIIEIGAARIRDGHIVGEFQSLVRAGRPVSAGATKVHHYTDDDLKDAPAFPETFARFSAFVGQDILVAHNGQQFDVPVLKRMAANLPGIDDFVFYDTLPVARALFRESVALTALADRFGIDKGHSHHALDDAVTLGQVVGRLNDVRVERSRMAALPNALDVLGLALALHPSCPDFSGEIATLYDIARVYTVGRFSDCLEEYEKARAELDPKAPPVQTIIDRLGGDRFVQRIRRERSASERYPQAMSRLHTLISASTGDTIEEQARGLLERIALSTSTEVNVAANRVNLLTLHATKGLEFSQVYIAGVEDHQIPGYYAKIDNRVEEIQEARRLLYVGMTRAKDRLTLTRTDRRRGKDSGGGTFLTEMGIAPIDRRNQP